MNLFQVDCFLCVADCLSFTEAAKMLYVSQPSVSQNVKALEKELGFALFSRRGRLIELTPAGLVFEQRARTARSDFNLGIEQARAAANLRSNKLSIGYDAPLAKTWFGKSVQLFHTMHPELDVEVSKYPMSALGELLGSAKIDMAIVIQHEVSGIAGIHFRPLSSEKGCLYLSPAHPLAKYPGISLDDLNQEQLIVVCNPDKHRTLTKSATMLQAVGLNLDNAIKVTNEETAFVLVESGMGLFVAAHYCDNYAAQYDIATLDLGHLLPETVLGIASLTDSTYLDDYSRCAKKAMGQNPR